MTKKGAEFFDARGKKIMPDHNGRDYVALFESFKKDAIQQNQDLKNFGLNSSKPNYKEYIAKQGGTLMKVGDHYEMVIMKDEKSGFTSKSVLDTRNNYRPIMELLMNAKGELVFEILSTYSDAGSIPSRRMEKNFDAVSEEGAPMVIETITTIEVGTVNNNF